MKEFFQIDIAQGFLNLSKISIVLLHGKDLLFKEEAP